MKLMMNIWQLLSENTSHSIELRYLSCLLIISGDPVQEVQQKQRIWVCFIVGSLRLFESFERNARQVYW